MKKRFYHSIMSLIVVGALSCSIVMGTIVQGLESTTGNIIVEKVKDMLPLIYTQEISEDDDVRIGSPISAYHLDENRRISRSDYVSYPIFINGVVEAVADVIEDDNGDVSQVILGVDFATELQQELSKNPETAFAVFYVEDGVYMKFQTEADDEFICLKSFDGNENIVSVNNDESVEIEYAKSSPVNKVKVDAQIPITENTFLFKTLNISKVDNASTPCCSTGICWAASIAMMANYHLGSSFDAIQIHDRFGCLPNDYHTKEKENIRNLGMRAGGPYYSTGNYRFNFSTLYDCIEADMLLLLDLQDYGRAAHNVVSYGYYGDEDSLFFYYMDPNTGGRIASFPANSSEKVYVPLSGYNYEVHCYITGY